MDRIQRSIWWMTVAGLSAAAAGLLILFVRALTEVLADPSLSLEDGYWIGRLPWTAVGVDLVVVGATVAVVAGTIAVWLAGGWIRRMVASLAAGVAAFWWLLVMLVSGTGAYCAGCPAPDFDPFTMAYTLPQQTLLLLVAPPAVIGVIALMARRSYRPAVTPSSQMKTT
jgi:hypothetical protein